jgi:hypothetical protein
MKFFIVILLISLILYVQAGNVRGSTACLECKTTCALYSDTQDFPCYQGIPKDANACYNTDPLLPDGEKYVCGTCADLGYVNYLRNDPLYTKMELWTK